MESFTDSGMCTLKSGIIVPPSGFQHSVPKRIDSALCVGVGHVRHVMEHVVLVFASPSSEGRDAGIVGMEPENHVIHEVGIVDRDRVLTPPETMLDGAGAAMDEIPGGEDVRKRARRIAWNFAVLKDVPAAESDMTLGILPEELPQMKDPVLMEKIVVAEVGDDVAIGLPDRFI